MLSVLWLIVWATAKNRVRAQLRRLKQPKYLIATLLGLAYVWFLFGRRLFGAGDFGALPAPARPVVVLGVTAVALGLALVGWVMGKSRAALSFTEAEIQLLFPGPTSRRSLLLYKIARSLVLVLLSSAVMTLLFGARLSGSPLYFLVGSWLAFSSFSLHETAATLTRSRLLLGGPRGVALLAFGLIAVVAALGGIGYLSVRDFDLGGLGGQKLEEVGAWFERVLSTPLGLVLYPVRAPIEAALAPDAASFLRALPASALVLALHVLWVLRSNVSFEEASVEAAEKRARLIEQRRGGRGRELRLQRPKGSLRLRPTGRPEWALAWKNLVAARRLLGGKLVGLALPFVVLAVMLGALSAEAPGGRLGGVVIATGAFAAFLVVMGPSTLRTDFRMDHQNLDILRTLPLSGLQVVVGQLLGPAAVLIACQWAAIALALALSLPLELPWLPLSLRVALALCAALLAPPLTASGLVIQNATVLLLPTWSSAGLEQARGFEGMGQRLLTLFGSLLVMVVGILPAAAAGAITLLLVWITVGPVGAPLAAAVAAGALTAELALAVMLLGRAFDRFDVSAEG